MNLGFVALPVVAFAMVVAQVPPRPVDRDAALIDFHDRVQQYADLHRELEASLPALERTADAWSLMLARKYLGAALRSALPSRVKATSSRRRSGRSSVG